jgi:hypothetical protein
VTIRTHQPGDETAQAEIYNAAAGALPNFKPTSAEEIRKRNRARDFDPTTRLFTEEAGRVVGYVSFHANGRVSFPWCLPGRESARTAMLQAALDAMRARGIATVFAAYRQDWESTCRFFLDQGFIQAREMVNFVLDEVDMPTRPGSRRNPLTPARLQDIAETARMGTGVLRTRGMAELERYLFHNPYFSSQALFVIRGRDDQTPLAVALLVADTAYANPHQVDANMPCFRLGAFGTEGLQTKRINGLFSFLAQDGSDISSLALDLMGQALAQFEDTIGGTLAAQVPSDAKHLLRFYQHYFRRQGAFPVFERSL